MKWEASRTVLMGGVAKWIRPWGRGCLPAALLLVAGPWVQAHGAEPEPVMEAEEAEASGGPPADPGEAFLTRYYGGLDALPRIMETEFPVYPAVRMAGSFRKIAGVDVNRPYFYLNRKKLYVREGQQVAFLPVSHFAGQFIDLKVEERGDFEAEGTFTSLTRSKTEWVRLPETKTGAKRSLVSAFTITADSRIRRAYIAHVFFDDDLNSMIFWRQVGSLREGESRTVEMVTDPIPRDGSYPHNFILVFSLVGEHRTSRRMEISKTLAALDLKWSKQFVQYYVDGNPMATLPAFPIYHGSMILPRDYLKTRDGGTLRVYVEIDPFGYVHNPSIEKSLDPLLDKASVRNVMTWKFFPALRDGFARSTRAFVPFVFIPEEEKEGG